MVTVLSLAVGIGANTSVFSLLQAVRWRSLPVREPGQLRVLNWMGSFPKEYSFVGEEFVFLRKGGQRFGEFSGPLYGALRQPEGESVEVFAYSRTEPLTAVTSGGALTVAGLLVSGNFFAGYGAGPSIGRPIRPEDDRREAEPVAVITHRWWERHLGSDPQVVGRAITLNGRSLTIIGVLPRGFAGPLAGDAADVYLPLALQPAFRPDNPLASPHHYWLQVMLRLQKGASESAVRPALEVAFRRHQQELSESGAEPPTLLLMDGRCGPWIAREALASPLAPLAWMVGLVLLVACANAGSLLLARNAVRQHEMAVRAALGAGRWRLIRQVLADSVVLAVLAAGLGLIFAWWGQAALVWLLPGLQGEVHFDVRLDARVLLFTVGATAVTALLVGLLPGLMASRVTPAAGLRNPRILGTPRLRLGKLLVVGQMAMALVLVTGAGLMARTLTNLRRVDMGFDPHHLLVFRLNATQSGHPEAELPAFYERVREAVAAIPGVRSAGFSDQSHVGAGFGAGYGIEIAGRAGEPLSSSGLTASDTFLATMGIPLLQGRWFNTSDTPSSGRVIIVNQAFAEKMFPGETPVGKTCTIGGLEHAIVGVCGNARLYDFRMEVQPIVYFSYRQRPSPEAWFEARTALPPTALGTAVSKAVAQLDATIAVAGLTTQRELADRLVAQERMFASLGGGLALLSLGLSCVGIHGLMAYLVRRRTGEIGLRLALGARPIDVSRGVLQEAALLAGTGALLGGLAAVGATRVLRGYLYGVAPQDPLTLTTAAVLLGIAAIVAAWLPARRAARVDPLLALRCE